jgi:ATP-dependent RNA helicase DDX21
MDIARKYLKKDHEKIDLIGSNDKKSSDLIEHLAILTTREAKHEMLADLVKLYGSVGRTIVFADTKQEANEIATSSSIRGRKQNIPLLFSFSFYFHLELF